MLGASLTGSRKGQNLTDEVGISFGINGTEKGCTIADSGRGRVEPAGSTGQEGEGGCLASFRPTTNEAKMCFRIIKIGKRKGDCPIPIADSGLPKRLCFGRGLGDLFGIPSEALQLAALPHRGTNKRLSVLSGGAPRKKSRANTACFPRTHKPRGRPDVKNKKGS